VARQLGLDAEEQARLARKVSSRYRKAIAAFADLPTLELWTTLLDVERFVEEEGKGSFRQHLLDAAAHARRRSGRQAVARYAELHADGHWQLRHEPPLLWRHRQVDPSVFAQPDHDLALSALLKGYLESVAIAAASSGERLPDRGHCLQGCGGGFGGYPLQHHPASGASPR